MNAVFEIKEIWYMVALKNEAQDKDAKNKFETCFKECLKTKYNLDIDINWPDQFDRNKYVYVMWVDVKGENVKKRRIKLDIDIGNLHDFGDDGPESFRLELLRIMENELLNKLDSKESK